MSLLSATSVKPMKYSLRRGLVFEVVDKGGGMILIMPPKLKRNPDNKLKPIVPRAVAVEFQVQPPQVEPERKERSFERPPILYGPDGWR